MFKAREEEEALEEKRSKRPTFLYLTADYKREGIIPIRSRGGQNGERPVQRRREESRVVGTDSLAIEAHLPPPACYAASLQHPSIQEYPDA